MFMNTELQHLSRQWLLHAAQSKYEYNFSWMGHPIIHFPQDMWIMADLVWRVQPDLIIETGIAHGGSLILSASLLSLLDYCDAQRKGTALDPSSPFRKVLGIDIDIRAHNRAAIEKHPMFSRIKMIEGSSIEPTVIAQVKSYAYNYENIMLCLDSHHTHEHVLAELNAYAGLVTRGSYCVVFDTGIEDLPAGSCTDRPWGKGNNPKTAVWEFLKTHPEFELDQQIMRKVLLSSAPDGFLKRVG
jgi:cephalosporin hydroxylase